MAKKNSNKTLTAEKRIHTESKHPVKLDTKNLTKKDLMGFDKKKLINVFKMMVRSRIIDNKAMRLLKQGKTFFHIAAEGHEAVQMAIGMQLDVKKDWLFPYYRDLGTVLMAGNYT